MVGHRNTTRLDAGVSVVVRRCNNKNAAALVPQLMGIAFSRGRRRGCHRWAGYKFLPDQSPMAEVNVATSTSSLGWRPLRRGERRLSQEEVRG